MTLATTLRKTTHCKLVQAERFERSEPRGVTVLQTVAANRICLACMAESRRIERPSRRSLRLQTGLRTAPRYSPNWRQASESNAQVPKAHSASNRGGLPNAQACRGGSEVIRTPMPLAGTPALQAGEQPLLNTSNVAENAGVEPAQAF